MKRSIDIIIVNWNSGNRLRECIHSVNQVDLSEISSATIYIVDNNSTDNSLQTLPKSTDPRIQLRLIKNRANKGFGVACNQGAKLGQSDYILFVNPDVRLEKNAVAEPLRYLESNPDFGACGIALKDDRGDVSRCCARFPQPIDFYARSLGLDKVFPSVFKDYMMIDWDHVDSRKVDHVIGAFYLVRRPVFESIGGFDENFFLYFEDLDLSKKISGSGFHIYYLGNVHSYHEGGGSSKQILARRLYLSLLGRLKYARKHFGILHWFFLTCFTLFLEPLVRFGYALARLSLTDFKASGGAALMLWRWALTSLFTAQKTSVPNAVPLPFSAHSIDWNRALGTSLFYVANNSWRSIAISALRGCLHIASMRPQVPPGLEVSFLFFKSITRGDYNQLFGQISSACEFEKKVIDHKYAPSFNIKGLVSGATNIRMLFQLLPTRNFRLWESLYLYTSYIRCLQFIDCFSSAKIKNLVVFGDMQQLDNCLVQYLKQKRCITATLQHGLYLDTTDDPSNINYVNFMNIVSEYFLSWGDATKSLVEKYSKAKVNIVGKPLPPLEPVQAANAEKKFFAILFDTSVYKSQNKLLLAIANEVEKKLSITALFCLHPDNDPEEYGIDKSRFLDRNRIGAAEFIIGHSTTFLIELMCLGKQVFRMRSEIRWHEVSDGVIFEDANELMNKIGKPLTSTSMPDKFIACVGEESLAKYKNFFRHLAQDRSGEFT